MNAQEAIELVEKERDDLSELVYKIESNWSESRLRSTREEIEALSIVLESAKVLHENIVEGSVDTNGHGVYSVEIKQRGDENTIYLSSKKLLAIGI